MTASSRLLVLTMPGFGIATLQHLVSLPQWRYMDVHVGVIGPRPASWRRCAAWLRYHARARNDRVHRLTDASLCVASSERFLRRSGAAWQWLGSDDEVRSLRSVLRPALTLTITSRIVFTARTLAEPGGAWFNVHPGLLPDYAGASPAPYMFLDGIGGCTIHQMAERVDAGAVVDLAPMEGEVGRDGGEYFFERLPVHTARRVATLIDRWHREAPLATVPLRSTLRHCTKARLAFDRRLDWCWPAPRLERWVHALAAIAPAWWVDVQGRRVEVMQARALAMKPEVEPGTVLRRHQRWVDIACGDGAIALRCRSAPRAAGGDSLPAIAEQRPPVP
jgi:methionyl-tRNA formyltransferase